MKLTLRKGLLALLFAICLVCSACGIAACGGGSDDSSDSDSTTSDSSVSHNFSSAWSYDNTYHWHECTDEGCDEVSGYAEHDASNTGSTITINGVTYVTYTCATCGAEYHSDTYTYIVNVKNIGNAGVSGASVSLYDENDNLLSTVSSGTNGIVRFRGLEAGDYTAIVEELPVGYSAGDSSLTVELTADTREGTVYLTPHLITADEAEEPSNVVYSLGSVVYDHTFTVYYNDGTSGTISLSEYLEKYDVIVLQFFYTSCNPCLTEFPYINSTYNSVLSSDNVTYYNQSVGLIEICYPYNDSLSYLTNTFLKSTYSCNNVPYAYDTAGWQTAHFSVGSWPTTVTIDRYGVITEWDVGSNPTYSYWTKLFEAYIGDDYTPNYVTASSGDDDDSSSALKPTADMPESGEIANAIVTENAYTAIDGTTASDTGTFEFSAYYVNGELDEYSWPWLIAGEEDDEVYGVTDYIYTSNAGMLGTYAILVIDVQLEAGQVFMFDYLVSTEADGDYLYIQVDTVLEAKLSGVNTTWDTFYYVAQSDGYYQITLLYQKNTSTDDGNDTVYAANMRIGVLDSDAQTGDTSNDILDTTTVLATSDLLYSAATAYSLSTTEGETQDDYGAGIGYANYVTVYLATDGYYHVNYNNAKDKVDGDEADDDDPLLLADLYYATPWNQTYSVWNIAYAYLYTTSEDEDYSVGTVDASYTLDNEKTDTFTITANSYYTFTAGSGSSVTLTSGTTSSALYSGVTLSGTNLTTTVYLETGDVITITSNADGSTLEVSTSGKGILYDDLEVCTAAGKKAYSYAQAIEDYAWQQINNPIGYVPVNAELAEILKAVTYSYGPTARQTDENQWLEVCRYYIHYGAVDEEEGHDCLSLDNLAISYGTRMPEYVGSVSSANTEGNELDFHANVAEALSPRGFYYSFTVETTGVYLIYTNEQYHDADGYNADGSYGNNPYIWVTDKDAFGISENDNADLNMYDKDGKILVYESEDDEDTTVFYNDNAYVYAYLLEGETYMVGCAMSYITDTGEYDVSIRYLGETYTYFTTAVESDIYTYRYTYDESTDTYTYEYYLPSVFASAYTDDNDNWYAINTDGTISEIYINMTGITYLNSSYSTYTIEQAIENGAWTGESLEIMTDYLEDAKNNTDTLADGTSLNGYVRANKELTDLLNVYINGGTASSDSTYASTAWYLTAYFTRTISTYTVSSLRVIDSASDD